MRSSSLKISTTPHIVKGYSTDYIMKHVVISLIPAALFAIYSFGINALLQMSVAILSCVITEHYLNKWAKKESPITDWSAVITGLLLAMTLPPAFPLWMTIIGGVIAIALGKFAFGGLGSNAFNPALVGRAVLQAAFPVAITTWTPALLDNRFTTVSSSVLALPFMEPIFDAVTGATPLSNWKFNYITTETSDLALGLVSGSTGETSALFIIIGGIYLIARNFMNWRIPATILVTVFIFSGVLYLANKEAFPSPFFMIFSGGLFLGAFFMASDMVGSPITSLGIVVYGVFIGVLVVVIRIWGGLPEGIMYAILLGNALTPHIDNLIKKRVYGTVKIKAAK